MMMMAMSRIVMTMMICESKLMEIEYTRHDIPSNDNE